MSRIVVSLPLEARFEVCCYTLLYIVTNKKRANKQMEKLRMQSANGVEDNIQKIAQLFPDCVTETVDEKSGQLKHLIDFEKLKQNLSDSIMSERAERYQFTWPDKSKAILLANSPINAALVVKRALTSTIPKTFISRATTSMC